MKQEIITNAYKQISHLARGNRKQEKGNRKYLFVPKTTKQSIQHKNHTIYYIYVDMIKRSSKNIEYGLKKKDNVIQGTGDSY